MADPAASLLPLDFYTFHPKEQIRTGTRALSYFPGIVCVHRLLRNPTMTSIKTPKSSDASLSSVRDKPLPFWPLSALIICVTLPTVSAGVINHSPVLNVSTPATHTLEMASAPVIISASAKHTATLIFLHGLGDTGHGWASAMGGIKAPFVKVICPTAQMLPVTLNSGFKMPAWFDLKALDINSAEDSDGIKKASELVHSMIEAEIGNGIPSNRIVIGGFSQGGALALYSALTYTKPLAGVVALSCWLPLFKTFPDAVKGNKDTPILQCHGDCDPLVPVKWGQMTASLLKQFTKNVDFKTYTGLGHSSSDEEMQDMKTFVQKVLPSV